MADFWVAGLGSICNKVQWTCHYSNDLVFLGQLKIVLSICNKATELAVWNQLFCCRAYEDPAWQQPALQWHLWMLQNQILCKNRMKQLEVHSFKTPQSVKKLLHLSDVPGPFGNRVLHYNTVRYFPPFLKVGFQASYNAKNENGDSISTRILHPYVPLPWVVSQLKPPTKIFLL